MLFEATPKSCPRVLIYRCVDSRFYTAIDKLIAQRLALPAGGFKMMSIPGGPARLAYRHKMQELFQSAIDDAKFVVENFESITKIVFIAHHDCGYYKKFLSIVNRGYDTYQGKKDLSEAKNNLLEFFPCMEISSYYGRLTNDCKEVLFEKIF